MLDIQECLCFMRLYCMSLTPACEAYWEIWADNVLYYFAFNLILTIQSKPVRDWISAGEIPVGRGVVPRRFDRVHRIIIVIAKGLPAHFSPDQFLGVALRAVSWQPVQGQVLGHDSAWPDASPPDPETSKYVHRILRDTSAK